MSDQQTESESGQQLNETISLDDTLPQHTEADDNGEPRSPLEQQDDNPEFSDTASDPVEDGSKASSVTNLESVNLLSPEAESVDLMEELEKLPDDGKAGDHNLQTGEIGQSMEELSLEQPVNESPSSGENIQTPESDNPAETPNITQYFQTGSETQGGTDFFDSIQPTPQSPIKSNLVDNNNKESSTEQIQDQNDNNSTDISKYFSGEVGKGDQGDETRTIAPKDDPFSAGDTGQQGQKVTELPENAAHGEGEQVKTISEIEAPHSPPVTHFPDPTTPPLPASGPSPTPPFTATSPFIQGEDPFSLGISMSDTDRKHDAWIPPEATRQVLVAMVTSPPGTYFPTPDQMTMPGLLYDEAQGDPVQDLVYRYMGEQEALKRKVLSADSVSQDEEGLRKLIHAECYRAAIDLTSLLLTAHGQGMGKVNQVTTNTPWSLQIWFCRASLMTKLRMYSLLESEMLAFGNLDKADLYYEYHPETHPGRKGSMVPFGFRLLHAELPQHLGKSQESLDRLYYIHAVVKKILSNLESGLAEDGSMVELTDKQRAASRELWELREIRVLYCIGNCLIGIKDYTACIEIFEDLMKKDSKNKIAIKAGLGRIFLQMGDIDSAKEYFKEFEASCDPDDKQANCRNLIHKGFVALGENRFEEAKEFFKKAVNTDPDNGVAVNNMAVCSLYTGKLKEAVATLEKLVHTRPNQFLQDGILFNLCTLYELESSRALHKKQTLLDLVSKYKGNGFNIAALKMI